jgi:hypothetical protein
MAAVGTQALQSEESGATSLATAIPTGLFAEPTIVDRPGVPASLYDKYWNALGQAGQVGTTALVQMPPDEAIFAVDAGRVASYPFDDDYETVVGPNGVTITVRDIRSGVTLRAFDTSVDPLQGLMVGSLLFWRGVQLPREQHPIDGGVWVLDLQDPASTPRAIIPAADLSAKYGARATRGPLRVTDHGRTLFSNIGLDSMTIAELVDLPSLEVREPFTFPQGAAEMVGGAALVVPRHGDGFDANHLSRLRLIQVETGDEIWRALDTDLVMATFLGDDEVFVQFGRNGSDAVVARIDLATGEVVNLRVSEDSSEMWLLSRELSAADALAFRPVDDLSVNELGRVQLPLALLDPVTGQFEPNAIAIGSP